MSTYKRPKHVGKVIITKKTDDGMEIDYLRRWYIFRCRLFSIRLHHIVEPDTDRDPHDHPWPFLSIVLRGGYTEVWGGRGNPKPTRVRDVRRFSFHRRTDVHRILRFNERGSAWTLMLTGVEKREKISGKTETIWGFTTAQGWVFWADYLNA